MARTVTPKQFYSVAADFLPDVVTALYTPAAGVTAVIEHITANYRGTEGGQLSRGFTLWIGPTGTTPVAPGDPGDTGASSIIFKDEQINASEDFSESRVRVIEAGMTLWGIAEVINQIALRVDGVEITGTPSLDEAFVTTPKQLAQGQAESGGAEVLTPAAGVIAIVHTITIVNADNITHEVGVYQSFTASGRIAKFSLPASERWVSPPGIYVITPESPLSISDEDGPPDNGLMYTIDGAERVAA